MSSTLAGLDELLGSEGGCPLALSFLANTVCGVVSNVHIVRLEGAAHAAKADAGGKQALVRRIGEAESGRAAGVSTKRDGLKDSEDGFCGSKTCRRTWVVRRWGSSPPHAVLNREMMSEEVDMTVTDDWGEGF